MAADDQLDELLRRTAERSFANRSDVVDTTSALDEHRRRVTEAHGSLEPKWRVIAAAAAVSASAVATAARAAVAPIPRTEETAVAALGRNPEA